MKSYQAKFLFFILHNRVPLVVVVSLVPMALLDPK